MKNCIYKILFYTCLMGALVCTVLTLHAQTVNQNLALCKGDVFRGHKINMDTSILIQNQHPVLPDTLFHIHAILPVKSFQNHILCPGESFLGLHFLKDTTVARTYPNATTGCDSIVYYVLTVKTNSALQIIGDTAFCEGETKILSVGYYPVYTWSTGETIREKVVKTSGIYMVSVTDVDGCTLVAAVHVIASEPQLAVESLSPNCPNIQDGMIDLVPSGGVSPYTFSLNGQVQQDNGLFSNLKPGSYIAIISDAIGCRDTVEIVLDEPEPLTIIAPEDVTLTAGEKTRWDALITGTPVEITWSPGSGLSCTDCPSPEVMPSGNTLYIVVVKNENGCIATDSVWVTIDKTRKIYIPNAFQPDTEVFTIFSGEGVSEILSFNIFDRWGELVHHVGKQLPDAAELTWNGEFNGKKLPADVYLYEAQVLFGDGVKKAFQGDILLVR